MLESFERKCHNLHTWGLGESRNLTYLQSQPLERLLPLANLAQHTTSRIKTLPWIQRQDRALLAHQRHNAQPTRLGNPGASTSASDAGCHRANTNTSSQLESLLPKVRPPWQQRVCFCGAASLIVASQLQGLNDVRSYPTKMKTSIQLFPCHSCPHKMDV